MLSGHGLLHSLGSTFLRTGRPFLPQLISWFTRPNIMAISSTILDTLVTELSWTPSSVLLPPVTWFRSIKCTCLSAWLAADSVPPSWSSKALPSYDLSLSRWSTARSSRRWIWQISYAIPYPLVAWISNSFILCRIKPSVPVDGSFQLWSPCRSGPGSSPGFGISNRMNFIKASRLSYA
ncbi:hypothetical protein BS47DRAFT_636470 [Hydnum rufescens UP504]|uniref:Uncharacterized protein n=1 Tax=Hydnum rufescens UP504 TaxID=1448309 RepID=A0A9P6BAX3_9AGAM|nr:hypothetical protein BS47DRAFT_636470 [Hydnum rufescens UP504]